MHALNVLLLAALEKEKKKLVVKEKMEISDWMCTIVEKRKKLYIPVVLGSTR